MVSSDAPASATYVDHLFRGVAPVTVAGLPAGEHQIHVRSPGHVPAGRRVTLPAGRPSEVHLAPAARDALPLVVAFRAELQDAALPGELTVGLAGRTYADELSAPVLGLVRVSPVDTDGMVGLELAAYELASGKRLVRIAGRLPTDPTLLAQAVGQLQQEANGALALTEDDGSDGRLADSLVARGDGENHEQDDEGTVFETWYFWTVVGAVAVGTGVATYLLLQSGDDDGSGGAQIVLQF